MVLRTSLCVLVITWLSVIHPVVGNEFKLVYNFSLPHTLTLQMVYDGFQIEQIKYNENSNYQRIQHSVGFIYISDPNLILCANYSVYTKVKNLQTNSISEHYDRVVTIPHNIVLQILPYETEIHVKVNSEHSNCYQTIILDVDNTKPILYTQTDWSSWLTVTNLSPCTNYNLTIYIENQYLIEYKIYNQIVRTASVKFREVKSNEYDPKTTVISWKNFLGDCSLKYRISIRQVINSSVLEPIERESVVNEYKLDFLEGCSKYQITITSEGSNGPSENMEIYTVYKEPSPVRNLKAELINNTVLISWSPPAKNPACFGLYDIYIDQTLFTTTPHEHTVLDYKPCKHYNIFICQTSRLNCVDYSFDVVNCEILEMHNVTNIHINTNYADFRTTISWNVSKHNERYVKYYDVRLYELDSKLEMFNKRVNSGMVEFGQLVACQKYRLHIESFPAQHWPIKIESNFDFTTTPTRPIPPQPLTFISKTSSSLTVETKYENRYDKCKIEMFQISCSNGQRNVKRSVYDEEGRVSVTNLRSGRFYTCVAMVRNEKGWSTSSESKRIFVEINTSGLFVEVYVNSVSSKSIDITWAAPYLEFSYLNIVEVESIEKYPKHCEFSLFNNSIKVDSRYTRIYKFDNLEPNTNYSIRVDGEIQNRNYSHQIIATTDPDVPFQVTNLKVARLTSRSVSISWKLPCKLNGRIKSFVGRVAEIDPTNSEESIIYDWSVPYYDEMKNVETFTYTDNSIKPEHSYKIRVAIKLANFVGPLNETEVTFNVQSDDFSDWATIIEENLELRINEMVLADYKDNGFKLLISELECDYDECSRECQFNILPSIVKISLKDDISPHCEVIDHNHIVLKQGASYTLVGELKSSGGLIKTTALYLSTKLQNHTSLLTIVIIVLICLAIMLIAIGAITWYYIKIKQQNSQPLDSTYVEVEYFYDFFKLLSQNYYANEYQEINDIDLSELDRSMSMNQPGKNRYTDITPYDYNRVVLKPNEFCTGDYINASHIDGYKCKRQYIATQGPTEATVYDFWHMVIEQKCDKIVMLTQLQEDSITKCFKYFPFEDEMLEFNDLTIVNVDETNFGKFIRRGLAISKGPAHRFIIHYQFNAWPDRGCPTNELDMIEFIEFTKSGDNKTMNPMVVHCSAGVGRTGTFIALDVLFQSFRKDKFISISETVRKLRRQRCRMVQTVDQYEFLYVSVNMYYLMRMYKGGLVVNN